MPTPPLLVLMLEDEDERLIRFEAVLSSLGNGVDFRHWRTAPRFIEGFEAATRAPTLLCLDHDLFTAHPDEPDPGDGRDVANYLAQQTPCCHIIIHSSNAPAADAMLFALLDANWDVEKIAPLGEDWIESYWWPTAKRWLS